TFISDSQARIDAYRRWWWRKRPTAVVRNGIFPPSSRRGRAEMRRELGLPADPSVRVIAQISRLIPYKGHRILLDAARIVHDAEPATAFLICGYAHVPGYREELEHHAHALGIDGHVRIVSYPGPIADVWRAVDIHAHASLYDSSPIA